MKIVNLLMTRSYPILKVRASSLMLGRLSLLLGHHHLRATEESEQTFFVAYNFVMIKWDVKG